ncbi:MAG: peptide ABC transporter ATP-binding protein, partial [Deltaproteobacteria bacterium]
RHPYTEALLNAVPVPDPQRGHTRRILHGEIPSAANPPAGCHFHPRCPYAREICKSHYPALQAQGAGRLAACHFSSEVGKYRAG